MTDAVGGYFELELRKGEHYHKNAIRLNSGRNCYEYILRARGYKRVYMPFYTCEVLYEPLRRTGVERIDYHINEQLELRELPDLKEGEAFLYTNYYGLKQAYVEHLAQKYGNRLIVDNAQAFYAEPIAGIDTFYSPRKFFGVADGGYLYTTALLQQDFPQAKSMSRMGHLLTRIEEGAEAGYLEFRHNDDSLDELPIQKMSKITEAILCSIDYEAVRRRRRKNYEEMAKHLADSNSIHLPMDEAAVPMVYPFLDVRERDWRNKMKEQRIFIPKFWPNVVSYGHFDYEEMLADRIMPLPIDQRYNEEDMKRIIEIILN